MAEAYDSSPKGYDWLWYKKKCPHRKELGQYHTPRDCPQCLLDARESFRFTYERERKAAAEVVDD